MNFSVIRFITIMQRVLGMEYIVAADTDIGIVKNNNQDSVCIITARFDSVPIVIAMIADGMGGLSKGELASATVINSFAFWFENEMPQLIPKLNWQEISLNWKNKLNILNSEIREYGKQNYIKLGSTFSGMLIVENEYMIVHIGDSRIYAIESDIRQLTQDHTVVAREVMMGNMTYEEAENDARRNVLLQCIGASQTIMPEIIFGEVMANSTYLICSDGFRHVISTEELKNRLNSKSNNYKQDMKNNIRHLIDLAKNRHERDNISAILMRTIE